MEKSEKKKKKFLINNEEEKTVSPPTPGKKKKINLFGRKKINSSDEFQVNLTGESRETKKEQDNFGYNEYQEQSVNNENVTQEDFKQEEPEVENKSGYIPNNEVNNVSQTFTEMTYTDSAYNNAQFNNNQFENNSFDNSQVDNNYYDDSNENIYETQEEPEEDIPLDNGDDKIKRLSDAFKRAKQSQNCLVVTILIVIALLCLLGKGIIPIIGAVISFISIIGAIFKYQDRVKYSKMVLYLAVIVACIYAFCFVFVYKYIGYSVDEAKSIVFKDHAIAAINDVRDKEIIQNKKLKCVAKGVKKENFSIPVFENGNQSPFGREYDRDASYVLVEAEVINNACTYKYSIYLTDGVYQLGTLFATVYEDDIEKTLITKR